MKKPEPAYANPGEDVERLARSARGKLRAHELEQPPVEDDVDSGHHVSSLAAEEYRALDNQQVILSRNRKNAVIPTRYGNSG